MAFNFEVNDHTVAVDMPGDTPLLWAIRESVGLTGTKSAAAKDCVAPARSMSTDGRAKLFIRLVSRRQIENHDDRGLGHAGGETARSLDRRTGAAMRLLSVRMIMAAAALLAEKSKPSDEDIANAMTNLCRCGTYVRIRRAIHRAAKD